MHAVILYLNEELERHMRDKWKELDHAGMTSSMLDVAGARPHVTLAVYDNLDAGRFAEKFIEFFKKERKLDVYYDVLGAFASSGALIAPPTVTPELMDLHQRYYHDFEEFNKTASSFYLPGRWVPHTTLALYLDQKVLIKSLEHLLKNFDFLEGEITEADFIKCNELDGKCTAWESVVSVKLK